LREAGELIAVSDASAPRARKAFVRAHDGGPAAARHALGNRENNGVVTFGLWLPWILAADGNFVRVIHERDQFLQEFRRKSSR
jgi:hypothetical protein